MRPSEDDLAVLCGVAGHLSQAVETAEANQAKDRLLEEVRRQEGMLRDHSVLLEHTVVQRTRELEEARIETLQRLAIAAEFRDDQTHQHTERVGRIAHLLATAIGLSDEDAAIIRRAAPLHDVGKLGVSDAILLKPGPLTAEEREIMKTHTVIGAQILSGSRSEILRVAEQLALTHHEHWDGRGYPRGIAGEAIPLPGRLTAIADVFDALTHERPYKEAWPLEDAVAEIVRSSGTQFDPRLVEAFTLLDHQQLLVAGEELLAPLG
jgi:putative two-component system response regulator